MALNKSYWNWDINTGCIDGGEFLRALFNLDCHLSEIKLETLSSKCTDDELQIFKTAFKAHVESHGKVPFQAESTHHISEKNEPIQVLWFGEVVKWSNSGEPLKMAGVIKKKIKKTPDRKLSKDDAFLYQRLMENLNESIFFKDLESRFILINTNCAIKFGLTHPNEAIGKTDFDFFDKEHAQKAYDDEQLIITSEQPIFQQIEKEIFAGNPNKIKWASTSKLPLYDSEGELVGTFGITRDITNQKTIEERLQKSDELFSKLAELAPGFLYLHEVDAHGKVTFPFVSEGIRELFGISPDAIKDSFMPLVEKVHPEDIRRVLLSIKKSVDTASEWDCEYRIYNPKLGLRWVKGKAKPERQCDGSLISPGYITDITDLKEASELNKELKVQFQSVFNSAPNLIFVKDLEGKYIMANEAASNFFGQTADEIIGKTDLDLGVPEEMATMYLETDKKVIENNKPEFFPGIAVEGKEERTFWYQTIKVPFHQEINKKPAVLSIVTDITERKEREQELNETISIVGEQNQRLTNFAHIVSHNLRNHAGNISMLLSLYDPDESEEERQEMLEFLKKASDGLNETIQDLNEIVDQQQKSIDQFKEINLSKVIGKVKRILANEILTNNVTFDEEIPDALTLHYNPAYLESIILNMYSNAIKYRNPNKTPLIKVNVYAKEGHTYFEISDNGLGIDLEKHGDKLFGMYKTFHGNKNAKGIGLFITKNQIEAMGGKIEVQSELGTGTTFKIRLK